MLVVLYSLYIIAVPINIVVELSDDRKKVRCNICEPSRTNGGWILKESLVYHLKSDAHAYSVSVQKNIGCVQSAIEQSVQEERALEESLDFVILNAASGPAVTKTACIPRQSLEEKEMWDNYVPSNEIFDAGFDHAAAALKERKRLEEEATNFDLWRGADFLPEEDPNDGQLLLDELEQDDILTELLRNARLYNPSLVFLYSYSIFTDLNAPDTVNILEEEPQRQASQTQIHNAWWPYESKMVT